jgi:hypothetical protein
VDRILTEVLVRPLGQAVSQAVRAQAFMIFIGQVAAVAVQAQLAATEATQVVR